MTLRETARQMVSKGILAADESERTMNKRFKAVGVEESFGMRLEWRRVLATCEGLEEYVSGVILPDEIIRKADIHGMFAKKGILPGIKVDKGTVPLANYQNETITEGLDGLRQRAEEYVKMGMKFAKWRAVLSPMPSVAAVQANAHALARYAAICQEAGLVPIVEPEVLMDGQHHIEMAAEATAAILLATFSQLHWQDVDLEAIVLKPNMVMYGYDQKKNNHKEVAQATLKVMKKCVPAAVPGIAFLSGGQDDESAVQHLHWMNYIEHLPWRVTFSYGRALQAEALKEWANKAQTDSVAHKVLRCRAMNCFNASSGLAKECNLVGKNPVDCCDP